MLAVLAGGIVSAVPLGTFVLQQVAARIVTAAGALQPPYDGFRRGRHAVKLVERPPDARRTSIVPLIVCGSRKTNLEICFIGSHSSLVDRPSSGYLLVFCYRSSVSALEVDRRRTGTSTTLKHRLRCRCRPPLHGLESCQHLRDGNRLVAQEFNPHYPSA